ncbi:MAG: hypothetical protein JXA74_06700 [Anaerolineae bacterium]|nr:hypothetical protein [Anaerolineae bacterium]
MTDLDVLLARHAAFWRHEPVERPLVRQRPARHRTPFENMDVTPDMIDVDLLTPEVGARDVRKHLVQGDLLNGICPFSRIPWMEALIGCQIHAGNDEAMWPKPALGAHYEGMDAIVPSEDNPWLIKLLALTRALVEANDDSYVVTHTLQRGPSDMLSALLGDERMGLSFYDAPDTVRTILARTAEAFIKVARAQYALIPKLATSDGVAGWVPWAYGLWAPGSVIRFQSDSSSQLSPRMYADYVLPADRTIMQAFDYSIIDLHSAGTLHIHPVLLQVEELDAISVTLDRYENAPSAAELLPTFAAILEHKSLSIFGEVTQAEFDTLLRELPPTGLAINVSIADQLLWQRAL